MNYIALAMAVLGNEKAGQYTQQELNLLGQQLARIQGVGLPNLPQVSADQLGPSAEAQLSPDEGLRGKQLAAISELQNQIDQGGLDYEGKAQLNEATQAAANQQHRAMAGVAADAAARGQLNSGNRLLMDMNSAQSGANAARSTGLATAAQAQQRRLAAIQEAAGLTSQLRGEDFSEKDAAARAKDLRDQRNAAAREKAQYYNAGLPQQAFNNAMAKATGTGNPTNALAAALTGAGADARMNAAGMAGVAGAMGNGNLYNQPQSGSTYDPGLDSGGQADLAGNRGGPQDLYDPNDK
jgi:hypothetical protein